MAKPQTTEKETETKGIVVKRTYLHAAVIIDNRTEQRLDVQNFPGIKMELSPSGLFVTTAKERHFIPGAQIKNCVLE